jgi:hypothetical protein
LFEGPAVTVRGSKKSGWLSKNAEVHGSPQAILKKKKLTCCGESPAGGVAGIELNG